MPQAQIIDCVNFMPERVVSNAGRVAEGKLGDGTVEDAAFFRGVTERRFASPEYTSGQLGIAAAKKLLERNSLDPKSIDLIVTSCVLTDLLANGIGCDVVRGVGATNADFLNLDTNCTSWFPSIQVAKALIEAGVHKRILILTVTNFVSRLDNFSKLKASFTLGDGASATLMTAGDRSSVLAYYQEAIGDLYGHMRLEPAADSKGCYRQYWQDGPEPLTVNFSETLLDRIRQTATNNVPAAVREVLKRANLATDAVDMLITHQPNRIFIDGWRDALGIHPPRAFDTLDIYGNLFMGTVPVTLGEANQRELLKRDDIIVAATFANAGDHLAAIVLRW